MGKIAVLGAGNVGLSVAGHMALNGHDVRLYDRFGDPLVSVDANGGIDLTGEVEGRGTPCLLTSDVAEAVQGADTIIIVAPAFAHEYIGEQLAAVARPEQVILFQPGALGSAVRLLRQFAEQGGPPSFVAETPTSLYTCRKTADTTVYIGALKHSVEIASVPASLTDHCVDHLNAYFGNRYVAGPDALTVGLSNQNPIYHLPPSILNIKTVEDQSRHPLHSLVTPRIAAVIDRMDEERMEISHALGVDSKTFWQTLETAYGVTQGTTQERIVQAYGRQAFTEPDSLSHRYFTEDVPFGMVPWMALAEEVGVDTPVNRSLAELASLLCGRDFVAEGRTIEALGLRGVGRDGVRRAFIEGVVS